MRTAVRCKRTHPASWTRCAYAHRTFLTRSCAAIPQSQPILFPLGQLPLRVQVALCGDKPIIASHIPVTYWSGTLTLARLGTHSEGVHVCIKDAGRQMLIEARDFEEGPVLASSTVSLEKWTGTKRWHFIGNNHGAFACCPLQMRGTSVAPYG